MHQKLTCQSSENQGTRAYNAASAFCEKKKKAEATYIVISDVDPDDTMDITSCRSKL